MGKKLVAYFSASGTTRKIAEMYQVNNSHLE